MNSFSKAYFKLSSTNSDVSCHYLISRNGKIYSLVSPNFKAWHAGKSEWKKYKNLNDYSLGIELQNKGHENGYQKFTKTQYNSLFKLISKLSYGFRISPNNIIAHSDISPNRKKDPGENFDWEKINYKNKMKKNTKKKQVKNISIMLEIYGFSKNYIKLYRNECIIAVKRKLQYIKINKSINKSFIKDFKLLIL